MRTKNPIKDSDDLLPLKGTKIDVEGNEKVVSILNYEENVQISEANKVKVPYQGYSSFCIVGDMTKKIQPKNFITSPENDGETSKEVFEL